MKIIKLIVFTIILYGQFQKYENANLKNLGETNKMNVTRNYTGKCHNCDREIGVFVEVYFKRNEGINNEQWCLDCVTNKGKVE